MASILRLTAFTRVPHIEMIARIRNAISASGGFMLDSHMFSNAMLGVNFEVRENSAGRLIAELEAAGLCWIGDSVRAADALAEDSDATVAGLLSVNFIHDDPPLRIEVPAVPG